MSPREQSDTAEGETVSCCAMSLTDTCTGRPLSLMSDRRVVRGNTYSGTIARYCAVLCCAVLYCTVL